MIRTRRHLPKDSNLVIAGIFAHYSDERCETLPFGADEDGREVSTGRWQNASWPGAAYGARSQT